MNSVRFLALSLLVFLVGLVACGGASNQPDPTVPLPVVHGDSLGKVEKAPAGSSEADAALPIDDDDPVLGSRQALVTIVEFTDFQCPFCSRAYVTLERLAHEYGPETLRVVFKNMPLPFHPMAKPAAEAGIAIRERVGVDAFWRFYRLVFENQSSLSDTNIEAWASQVGLPPKLLHDAVQTQHVATKLERDHSVGEASGVNGTPAFFVNGVSLMGAQPYEKFKETIDAAIASAKEALAKGADRDKLYRTLVAQNFKKPVDDDDDPVDTTVWKGVVGTSPTRGPATAPVTMLVFSDFQCPFCKKVEPTLKALTVKYGNDLRLVWKNYPLEFHPRAIPAAMLALEARAEKGDAGFWDAHDRLFSAADLDDTTLESIATAMSLDLKKVKEAIAKKKYQSVIDSDQDLGDDVSVNGTPHFLINGRALGGNQPLDKFIALIDEEMTKAKAKIAGGMTAADYYADLMKSAQTVAAPTKVTLPPTPATPAAPTRGAQSAPVAIVVYGGYQDPYSRKLNQTLKDLMAAYPGKLKLQWRQFPLANHTDGRPAAIAALEAFKQKGNDGFWKMHDLLMTEGTALDRAGLEAAGKTVGLDAKRLAAALDGAATSTALDADAASAKALSVSATPQTYVGGYPISGALAYRKFRRLVDRSLADLAPPGGKKP